MISKIFLIGSLILAVLVAPAQALTLRWTPGEGADAYRVVHNGEIIADNHQTTELVIDNILMADGETYTFEIYSINNALGDVSLLSKPAILNFKHYESTEVTQDIPPPADQHIVIDININVSQQ